MSESNHQPEQGPVPDAEHNPLLPPIRRILEVTGGAAQTEFGLIQTLKADQWVSPDYSFNPLSLFRVHFQVFNALYRLQDEFAEAGNALVISPLAIYLRPLAPGESASAVSEAGDASLREFYLDWENYEDASETSVEELLASFWRMMGKEGQLSNDQRQEALAELDLADPVSPQQIKQQYRRLAMEHHPDRGGSEIRLQRINAAMAQLQQGR